MKKIYTILFVLVCGVLISGCSSKEEKITIDGIWNLVKEEAITKSATIGDEKIDIYLELNQDNTMSIYQKLGSDLTMYKHIEGTWSFEDGILSGYYCDNGKPYTRWNCSYKVERVGEQLILTEVDTFDDLKNLVKDTFQLVDAIPEDVLKNSRLVER